MPGRRGPGSGRPRRPPATSDWENPVRCEGLLFLSLLLVPAAFARQAALFDELAVICPDTDVQHGAEHYAGATPRGVPAGLHVLVRGLAPDAPVRCRLLHDDTPVSDAVFYQLIDVPVEQNTGLGSRTEAWDDKPNPHVVREAPFRVYEVLEPTDGTVRVDESGAVALRVELPIDYDADAERRTYQIALESGDWQQRLRWELDVHPVNVPVRGPQSRGYTNWFSTGLIAQRHDLKQWSEPYWAMLGEYADLMARGRQNTFWVRWGDFTQRQDDGTIVLDRPRLQRYVRLFLDRGFTCVEGGHLAGRHKGDWGSARLDFVLTGSDVTSEQGKGELAAFLAALHAALAELELPPHVQYLQHLADEPTDTNAESYRALAEQVRQHLPGVQIFEATMSQQLVGAVGVWCPQIQAYERHRDFFEQRKAAGDRVWAYTCLAPGGPWLNRLLDQERLRPVYIGWALEKYDLAGFLHWGLNHYRPGVDPLEQSVVPHGSGPPNFLPPGDSHVVYPGEAGPLSGQRFEAHRIGLEDAEMLRMLKIRDPDAAEYLINRNLRACHDYNKDVAAYRRHREELLTALGAPLRPGKPVSLFNGRDLAGWTAFLPDGTDPAQVWRVEDGVLVCRGRPAGYLRTSADYANYVLELEWRWDPATKQGGNSGVLLRIIGADRVWPRCVEGQLQHGHAGDFWNIGDFPMVTDPRRTEGRRTRKLHAAEKPPGEWNRYEITVDRDRVVLEINGVRVNEARRVLEIPGKIGLQSEGTAIHFRNIELTPLAQPADLP